MIEQGGKSNVAIVGIAQSYSSAAKTAAVLYAYSLCEDVDVRRGGPVNVAENLAAQPCRSAEARRVVSRQPCPPPPKTGGDARSPCRLGWYTEYNAIGHGCALRDGRSCLGSAVCRSSIHQSRTQLNPRAVFAMRSRC
jgi:hypothetical protein